jgi:recombination protein RecT
MALNNSLIKKTQKQKFSVAIQSDAYKNLINNTLGNPKKAERFIAAVTSAVAVNPALQECDAGSIVSAALLGETLNLSPSPQLGHYYMVPFNDKQKGKVANFILGWKGYLQLAIRSGYYKKINVVAIKEGELINYNPLEEEIEVKLIEDEEQRENAETIGYYAMFEYLNGFRKAMYWSKAKMEKHADTYSKAFSLQKYKELQAGKIPQADLWKYSSFWYKDFDGMAFKTMLRQLISKWGIMSIDLQKAFEADIEAEQKESVQFVENETIDDFFENTETPEEVISEEIIQPTTKGKSTKKDKEKAVDMQKTIEDELTEEELAIFEPEHGNFFDE